MGIDRTRDDDFICIYVESTVSSEQRCTSAETPGAFAVIAPRERDFEYQADHLGGRWAIRTNWDAPNYRLMTLADRSEEHTSELQSLMRLSYAVFCLKKKKIHMNNKT